MRRWLLPAGVYVAITIALTYPLLVHLSSVFPHDAGDPALNTWILWWNTQKIPLTSSWWNAPMFFPMAGAMALSELLLGLLPITAPIEWLTHNPLSAYNVAFLLSFPLTGLAVYALAEELTGRRDAALLAGLACLMAPYRMGQLAHLPVLSYYWAPVALLALHRYLRTTHWKWLIVFGVGWLMQALSNGYALFHFSVLVALWIAWFARSRRTAAPILGAWFCAAVPMVPILLKYREVHASLHLVRDINEIKRFGVDVADVLTAPRELTLWGAALGPARPETAIFPGATILIIGLAWLAWSWFRRPRSLQPRTSDQKILIGLSAIAGLVALSTITLGPWAVGPLTVTDFHKPFSLAVLFRVCAFLRGSWARRVWHERSLAAFYVIAMVAVYVLALGPEPRLFGHPILYEPPYAWLMRLPGFDVLRVPARFAMLGVLCQSVLLALALAQWSSGNGRRRIAMVVVGAGLIADGWIRLPVEPAPPPGPDWQNVAAVIELPPGGPGDFAAMYRSMFHRLPIVNGYSSYVPPHYLPLTYAVRDEQYSALQELAPGQFLGVAIHRDAPNAATSQRILNGMVGVTRRPEQDGWTSYIIGPTQMPAVALGPELPISRASANRHEEDAHRMLDHDVTTAWGSALSQVGDEEVLIDLGSVQPIGAIVFEMGAYSFGYPREIEVDSSVDETTWNRGWSGPTAVPTVHAAIADPQVVPLMINVGVLTGRYLRVRQTGTEPGIPWWIPEVRVFAPANVPR